MDICGRTRIAAVSARLSRTLCIAGCAAVGLHPGREASQAAYLCIARFESNVRFCRVPRGAPRCLGLWNCFEGVLVRPFLAEDPGELGSELLTQ